MKKLFAVLAAAIALSGCHYVPQGKVALRVNWDNTIDRKERIPGEFNQNFTGHYIDLPVKEIGLDVNDINPVASDNSTMSDFDVTLIYSINPQMAAELYMDKSANFHELDKDGETQLMHAYLKTAVRNAVYKVAREYAPMKMNDSRKAIETSIINQVRETLAAEHLDNSVIVTQVMVKSMVPSEAVKAAANRLVAAQSELLAKDTELQTANKEAARIKTLSENKGSLDYMDAQSRQIIAQAIAAGKVNTIILSADSKSMINVTAPK